MTVEDAKVIDFIGITEKADRVLLVVSDHLDWEQPNEHLLVLQEKLNTYVAFIESGDLYKKYPGTKGRTIEIDVRFLYPPVEEAQKFLSLAEQSIREVGFRFSYKTMVADPIN